MDPAAASLDVARAKPGAQRVRWLHGDATNLPELHVDLATMTANVAHVILTDEEWSGTLRGIHGATVTSDSTRRFWSRAEIEGSLRSAGYTVVDVHDAPDRPGFEWIFIARKPGSAS